MIGEKVKTMGVFFIDGNRKFSFELAYKGRPLFEKQINQAFENSPSRFPIGEAVAGLLYYKFRTSPSRKRCVPVRASCA
jgi:hypothetical protein